ncbi:uroporphyrinogen decarboxylase [Bacteroidia bacterium]|nr:uroporphyrinogen decarboxylase [Bacteroidia bacterium]
MSRRSDFQKILAHEQPERLIIDLGGCPQSTMDGNSMYTLLEYLGYGKTPPDQIERLRYGKTRRLDERLLTHFDIDVRSVGEIYMPADSTYEIVSPDVYIDEWGCRRTFSGMYWEQNSWPLKGATIEDLEKFRWPNPDSIDMSLVERDAAEAKRLFEQTDYVVCAEHPIYGVFELGCWMCGFDDFLLRVGIDTDFVKCFFDHIWEYQKRVIEIYYGALGKYIHYTTSGDDFATQAGLFMSVDMFDDLVKPYLKKRIAYTKQFTDAAFLHHSCGSVFDLVPSLIDAGVDILNPIQPKAANMNPAGLKSAYGERIVFHGGLDTQEVLPFGTRESVEQAVRDTIGALNINGGYIFAAAHNIQEDVPPQNLAYMYEAARREGI